MSSLREALSHLSEPILDPAIIGMYLLSAHAARDGVKVLLNGTGGDEIFSGYTRYTGQLSRKRKLFMRMPRGLKFMMPYLPLSNKTKLRMQHLSLDMLFSTGGSFALAESMMCDKSKRNEVRRLQKIAEDLSFPAHLGEDLLYQRMLFDMHAYLPNELLFLLDQMTMAHTLEGRVPLLDIDVIKAAFQFNAKDHIQDGQTKALLKAVATPYLGKEHVHRKKQGFAGSTHWWVKENFSAFLEGIADINSIDELRALDIDTYANEKHLNAASANEIFILYCFNTWYKSAIR